MGTTGTTVLRGWGRSTASSAHMVAAAPGAAPPLPVHDRGALPRGMARSYGDAAQNAGGLVVDMTSRSRIHALDLVEGWADVDAGVTLDELLRAIVPHGWFLPIVPGTAQVTVGGCIASDVHGKSHEATGTFRNCVQRFTLQLADGSTRTVTPDDTEVFGATHGGMGLTGIVLDARIRLTPVSSTWIDAVTATTADLDATMALLAQTDATYSVAWVDLLSRGGRLGRGIVDTGEHAQSDDLPADVPHVLHYEPAQRLRVPPGVPGGLLNTTTARAFNTVWFGRAPRRPRRHLAHVTGFFFPLDAVADWNRAYGPRGFVQYQFAVPPAGAWAVRRIAERLADARCPTFVAVLKRFGPGAGMLSFPQDGWTLAVDIPATTDGLSRLLDACDDVVCEAGGRVYLAKDARLRADRMPSMYPDLDAWRQVRDRLDPQGRWRSDLGRRLGLCAP